MRFIIIFLLSLTLASSALAEDTSPYIKPDWYKFVQIMVSQKAMTLDDDDILTDEFAMIARCDSYVENYKNEFEWRKIRADIIKTLHQQTVQPIDHILYETVLQLDRYDFDKKRFRFAEKSRVDNVNAFLTELNPGYRCDDHELHYMPDKFRMVLSKPVTIPGIPMSPEAGEALITQMEITKNINRTVWAVFKARITNVIPVIRFLRYGKDGKATAYYLQGTRQPNPVVMDVELDSADFYADPEKKIKLYTYLP
jgi:hypothetical protein